MQVSFLNPDKSIYPGKPKPGSNELVEACSHPVAVFILQLIVIIVVARAFAWGFQRLKQPGVMGEIIAGIALGPSLLGWLSPSFAHFLFPPASISNLQMLSQIGLILFMFVIGMELDVAILKQKAGAAVLISHVSIIVPFALGLLLAYFIYQAYAPPHIPFYAFGLFMGISMSITAFPVLARVIRDRGLSQTRLGNMAITCAAAGDVTAWIILAFIIAIVKAGSPDGSFISVLLVLVYAALMLFVARPFLKWLAARGNTGKMQQSTVAAIFIILLLSAYCCEVIGIHALFGAFFMGVIMPSSLNFREDIIHKTEDVSIVLLLPLFFVFTGLRTQIGLLQDTSLWGVCGLIILVAVVGKFGGSALAAKITGETTNDSLAIGALMNTRGLMELIVLNIGYDLDILSPQIFTMMVIMAILTTLMTGPALSIINKLR